MVVDCGLRRYRKAYESCQGYCGAKRAQFDDDDDDDDVGELTGCGCA
jgi:hypothetical protein